MACRVGDEKPMNISGATRKNYKNPLRKDNPPARVSKGHGSCQSELLAGDALGGSRLGEFKLTGRRDDRVGGKTRDIYGTLPEQLMPSRESKLHAIKPN
jgi:hypothetical protein